MDGVAVHGWQALLVVKTSDEMYERILWKLLPSMNGRYPWVECNISRILSTRCISKPQHLPDAGGSCSCSPLPHPRG